MRLSSALGLGGMSVCIMGALAIGGEGALVALSTGCGSSGSGSSGGGSTGDTCQSAGVQCTVQPAAPSGGSPTSAMHNYAMYTLYLGDTTRAVDGNPGVTNSDAWQSYGYNLDNLVTTKDSTDVCTLAAGASKTTQVDGKGGIDNSFGENILPIVITTAGSDASTKINQGIQGGEFTVMMYVVGFDNTANSTANATGLTGALLGGGNYTDWTDGGTPAWNLMTHWPVLPELLMGCPNNTCPAGTNPITAANVQFNGAYQADGTFVNGSPATIDLSLAIGGQSLSVNIHSALITFQPTTSTTTPGVTNGTIAGTIITTELISALQSVAGHISTSLCSGSAFNSISQQIQQASDIIISSSGQVTNTAGTACNGISIGLGFDATEIAIPVSADIQGPPAAVPNPCDAGSD
jgi:hypothetical protein